MSSSICPHFAQNAWKKDLCSNCFKSKEEHKQSAVSSSKSRRAAALDITKTDYPNKNKVPARSIIKGTKPKSKKTNKVCFPKQISEVIGYGGDWSEDTNSDYDDDEFMNNSHSNDDQSTGAGDEEENLELKKLTKANTDFNMNNGNLLGDPQENIKKSFAALKLGAPQVDKEGKKQTLKINVTPFGSSKKLSSASKAKFEVKEEPIQKTTVSKISVMPVSSALETKTPADGKNSPPIERAMEKSLLEEISETLEQNKSDQKKKLQNKSPCTDTKIKFEITSLADAQENKPFLDLKKPIARNSPITKDQIKPKISVSTMQKYSDSESNGSDSENGISAYYDVVETEMSYENVPDGKSIKEEDQTDCGEVVTKLDSDDSNSVYSSSQYITDILLSSKTRSATYSLHEGNFMTSKITSDGLIVTKCSSDDALDSTGSSFDGSSDEETSSYNMTRSESDSGIGISIGNDYKNLNEKSGVEKKLSASTNNSDYEDIQVTDQVTTVSAKNFSLEKSRELAGEPDGSADPDGSLENQQQQLPALPKSPPPTALSHEARPSFLHGLQKNTPAKKPDLPVKPSVMKTFTTKRQPTSAEQQVITQLQQVMKPSTMPNSADPLDNALEEQSKLLKKGRAPSRPQTEDKSSAPPTPERDYNIAVELSPDPEKTPSDEGKIPADESAASLTPQQQLACATNSIYTRKQQTSIVVGVKSTASPVIREKDKRERATVNPKFRSLNTFSSHRKAQLTQQLSASPPSSPAGQFITLSSEPCSTTVQQSRKSFSLSEECLTLTDDMKKQQQQQKKNKFSIRKFLRMGASKTTDNLHKKDGIYSEIVTGDESGVVAMGKPRLVIIHPIDINPTAVEVVKDITKTNDNITSQTIVVTTNNAGNSNNSSNANNSSGNGGGANKPPAPPLRKTDSGAGQKNHEANKPARPPPPKSAELRRKQQKISFDIKTAAGAGGSVKCKADNVYANLGEIRSSIAPRKPERTASMREREAQLELARKRQGNNENADNISICSSNGDIVTADISQSTPIQNNKNTPPQTTSSNAEERSSSASITPTITTTTINTTNNQGYSRDSDTNSQTSSFERHKRTDQILTTSTTSTLDSARPSSLKDSVRKINSTIDSYLKDKRDYENLYEFVKAGPGGAEASSPPPPQPPARSIDAAAMARAVPARRPQPFSDNASISGASYTRSEYGSPSPRYGLNNSLANIPRVISASYCGSEIGEFDIYSPYSYYGSEAGGDVATDINDSVWGVPSAIKNRTKATNRLRMRKGRSVVHKTIEDNYTAVVVANHEALAQVLDQLQQTPIIPPALRPLANAINLRFEDFTVIEGAQAFVVGKKAFHAAVWTTAPVTLALSGDCNQLSGVGGELCQLTGGVSGVLNPITEFCDLVPSYHLPLMPTTEVRMLQATISVLPRLQLETLQSIGTILKNKSQMLDKSMYNFRGSIPNLSGLKENGMSLRNVCSVQNLSSLSEDAKAGVEKLEEAQLVPGVPSFDDVMSREVAFIMLQLVNGLKNLQAKAIEEMPLSLSNVVLAKDHENKDAQARLCVLQGNSNNEEDEPMGTLCRCAHIALSEMLPSTKMTSILADILLQERSESLSKAKAVLEFVLWGPSDVILSGSTKERELALQRWLDLERATVLHGLVRTRVELTIYDECHLMFLVRSNAKMMNDAAKIVSSYQSGKE
ncbi:uncharacterized protein LOC129952423 [Eupeodes corollae]|uniref:uncharacterized protein LOC129952423 n=1 Tax=Eupeodes corollae TaxID=290404 RepID=UPI0024925934|nr:uncharacterized protein LOC129952423 [Eupeodes corollae]XP_055920979.1 uncharacterized protein LOC129952423 [Eupeodes corollae]XP_055920987.1 uncharacterized protein LOC129952423 [Eupeodes corollae]XP_055920997.1 uncharacterized protein LOC129952423 [Eupeodes corollae]